MDQLKPADMVRKLDKYIIGQNPAKRSVAIALRNRWRRQHVREDLRDEIAPKNIILIGPTGVGKTEIARRISLLADAPFYKVEASKFTEVGYVGRDVESMVRDLLELTINQLKTRAQEDAQPKARELAEERLLDILLPKPATPRGFQLRAAESPENAKPAEAPQEIPSNTREKLRRMLKEGKLDERDVEVTVTDRSKPMVEIFSNTGMEEMGFNFKDMLGGLLPKNAKKRKMKVHEAREILTQEEAQSLVDMDNVVKQAIGKVEQSGIIFLDEIDKIVGSDGRQGPDVSREGVQRDLLPIVECSSVNTKYGPVKTDHMRPKHRRPQKPNHAPARPHRRPHERADPPQNRRHDEDHGHYTVPVDPKPPAPRTVSSRVSTTSKPACTTGATIICAIRAPWAI